MPPKIIAIHQPNFFPWLGFFSKIVRADCFVYLDHVESNTVQVWPKRVKIMQNGKDEWLTVPLKKKYDDGFPPINKMMIDNNSNFMRKHLGVIEQNYKKAPFFKEISLLVSQFYQDTSGYIAERNIHMIESFCSRLNIQTPRVKSSDLHCQQSSNELLIEIVKKLEGNTYLCGGGASEYQEDSKFAQAGIILQYQHFRHPVYPQFNTQQFIPGLSIIDALMNIGFAEVEALLKNP